MEAAAVVGPEQTVLDAAHLLIDHGRLDADLTLGLLQAGDVLAEVDEPHDPLSRIQLRQREIQQIHHVQFHIVREDSTLHFPKKQNNPSSMRIRLLKQTFLLNSQRFTKNNSNNIADCNMKESSILKEFKKMGMYQDFHSFLDVK